jgi:putative CocE/NonD family hydrolase
MRDGTHIALDIYHPAEEALSALYAVAPYLKDEAELPAVPTFRWRETGPIEWYVERGHAYVLADTRGSGNSEGSWRFFDQHEQHDTYDTIEWIADQSWCTGKVGMIGESYYAIIRWLAAAQDPPHLECIAPFDGLVDLYRDAVYHGGIVSSNFLATWPFTRRANHLLDQSEPLNAESMEYDLMDEVLTHRIDDAWYRRRSVISQLNQICVPTYSIGTWEGLGPHLRGNLVGFERTQAPKKLLVVLAMDGKCSARQRFTTECCFRGTTAGSRATRTVS